jgi:hypothetical protein
MGNFLEADFWTVMPIEHASERTAEWFYDWVLAQRWRDLLVTGLQAEGWILTFHNSFTFASVVTE